MTAEALDRVWAALPARRSKLGISLRRLPWGPDEIRRFVLDSLHPGAGTWVFGAPGAVGEFVIDDGEPLTRSAKDGAVTARTVRGSIRVTGFDRIRVLAWGHDDEPEQAGILALVVPREDVTAGAPDGLTALGPDHGALAPSLGDDVLYDLGLGMSPSLFCVRVADPSLRATLDTHLGRSWDDALRRLGPALVAASPTRVVTSPIGRVEILTPIPPPGGRSSPGPHTHLLPATLAGGHESPPALGIPAVYAIGALHYPDPATLEGHHAA